MTLTAKIGPSVLNADLSQLYEESKKLVDNGADYLHLDVMDGNFVPNLTFGHPVIKALKPKLKDTFFESHMMVANPRQWVEAMADAGVDLYTFHVEPVWSSVRDICGSVREAGMKVGLAIKPNTEVKLIEEYIDMADMILVMTVEPGFGGQKFREDMMPKVEYLRKKYPNLDIEVDGGVSLTTIDMCTKAGANMIVSGTAIINATNQKDVIEKLRCSVLTHACKQQ